MCSLFSWSQDRSLKCKSDTMGFHLYVHLPVEAILMCVCVRVRRACVYMRAYVREQHRTWTVDYAPGSWYRYPNIMDIGQCLFALLCPKIDCRCGDLSAWKWSELASCCYCYRIDEIVNWPSSLHKTYIQVSGTSAGVFVWWYERFHKNISLLSNNSELLCPDSLLLCQHSGQSSWNTV